MRLGVVDSQLSLVQSSFLDKVIFPSVSALDSCSSTASSSPCPLAALTKPELALTVTTLRASPVPKMALERSLIQGCQMAKFDPFLSLDCTRVEGVGAKPKKGRDQLLQRSVAEP